MPVPPATNSSHPSGGTCGSVNVPIGPSTSTSVPGVPEPRCGPSVAVRFDGDQQLDPLRLRSLFRRAGDRVGTALALPMLPDHHGLTRLEGERLVADVEADQARPRRGCGQVDDRNGDERHCVRVLPPRADSRSADPYELSSVDGEHSSERSGRREGRHRLLGRARHERGAALDARQGRDPVRLHRQPRPARRAGLRRDSETGDCSTAPRKRASSIAAPSWSPKGSPSCNAAPFTSRPRAFRTSTPLPSAAPSPARCSSSP